MTFIPPHCPYDDCLSRSDDGRLFYQRWGRFDAECRPGSVQRFRCRKCRRTFSVQTFRYDYRQKKPRVDGRLMRLLISGVGFRQSARILGVARETVIRKFLRLGAQCRDFHDLVARQITGLRRLQFDELETFEASRLSMPVTMGTLIDADTRFILEQGNAAIRPGGRKSARGRKLIAKHERRYGRRPSQSRACVKRIFERARSRFSAEAGIVLETDKKPSYVPAARIAFGSLLKQHCRYSGKLPRGSTAFLFPINHTNAMWRDNLSRLRRRSWLVSKKRSRLALHGWIFVVYRNYIRPRFNGEARTPAQRIGILERGLDFEDIIDWRHEGVASPS